MKLEQFIDDYPRTMLWAERYLNDGSPSGFSDINTTLSETAPRSHFYSYKLSSVEFGCETRIKTYGEIPNVYSKDFFIHPDMMQHEYLINTDKRIKRELDVVPTASGRTVYDTANGYFIKMAYLSQLGRQERHLTASKIISAVEVSHALTNAIDNKRMNKEFALLRESGGIYACIPNHNNRDEKSLMYEWGVLFREATPYPFVEEKEFLIPAFALFARNPLLPPWNGTNDPCEDSFLVQIFNKQQSSPEIFIKEKILFPLFSSYFNALLEGGIELEAHAQNILFTIDSEFQIQRIVCRDLESAARDIPLMTYRGIEIVNPGDYKCNVISPPQKGEKYSKYYIDHSFMFDFKLCKYLIEPLLVEMKSNFPEIDIEEIKKEIKSYNQEYIQKLPDDFFPKDWCYYENINWELTGERRKYIWKDNPPFR